MSILNDVTALVTGADAVVGNAGTSQQVPYVVTRPLVIDPDPSLEGTALSWDVQFSLYCCAASVEASFNLALSVIRDLDGAWVGGTALSASMGYIGAAVEGHYESQVTVQLNQGSI